MQFNLLVLLGIVSSISALKGFPATWDEFKVSADAGDLKSLYKRYSSHFAKNADNFELFSSRVKDILDWNSESHSYKKGINRFTDMTDDERRKFVMPEVNAKEARAPLRTPKQASRAKTLPNVGDATTCDLRPFTTSVKDQASCGSCWAFGTMAAAEGAHYLWSQTNAAGVPYNAALDQNDAWQVAEQSLIDCCHGEEVNGCGGGGTWEPVDCAAKTITTLPSTVSYPYLASDINITCSYSPIQAGVVVSEWYEPCASGDEVCLKELVGGSSCSSFSAVALKTSIEVISSFYDYESGVYSDASCPKDIHNHAVAIVGWGTEAASGMDYWIIRNSWNTDWGASGYILMERGNNMCCVACENLYFQ